MKNYNKKELENLINAICPDKTKWGLCVRKSLRNYAYKFGIEATKQKFYV